MEPQTLIDALKQVPPINLKLIDLTWQVMGKDGELDVEKCAFFSKEIEVAIQESRAYTQGTQEIVWSLRRLLSQS